MRARGSAARAHPRKQLALLDQIAYFDIDGRCMRVAGNQAVAVTDFNQLAVARHITCLGHHATGSRMERCAFGCGKIKTHLDGMTARSRNAPPDKLRGQDGHGWAAACVGSGGGSPGSIRWWDNHTQIE